MRPNILFLSTALLLGGCVSVSIASSDAIGAETDETRSLGRFDRVETSRGVDVALICGGEAKAVLHGGANDVAKIETVVEGGVLKIRRNSMWGNSRPPVHVDVTTPAAVKGLESSSGSSLRAPACAISPERLDAEASSGGSLRFSANTGRLHAEASSGGDIGPMKDGRIDARDAEIEASSGGSVRVCAIGHLDASASSGGTVVSESAATGNRSTSSGGDIATRRCAG